MIRILGQDAVTQLILNGTPFIFFTYLFLYPFLCKSLFFFQCLKDSRIEDLSLMLHYLFAFKISSKPFVDLRCNFCPWNICLYRKGFTMCAAKKVLSEEIQQVTRYFSAPPGKYFFRHDVIFLLQKDHLPRLCTW